MIIESAPVPIGLGFGFGNALGLGLGLKGPDLGLGLDNKKNKSFDSLHLSWLYFSPPEQMGGEGCRAGYFCHEEDHHVCKNF